MSWSAWVDGSDTVGDVEEGADPLVRARLEPERRAPEPDPLPDPADAEERALNLLARHYAPGQLLALAERLGDVQAQLDEEEAKIARAGRRQERIRRDHEAGRIRVADLVRLQDLDEGDPDKVKKLAQRAESLRRQMQAASALVVPQQGRPAQDPLEATTARAHREFVDALRAKVDEAAAEAWNRPIALRRPKEDGPCICPACTGHAEAGRAGHEADWGEYDEYSNPYGQELTRACDGQVTVW
jgi:hypothetical protein